MRRLTAVISYHNYHRNIMIVRQLSANQKYFLQRENFITNYLWTSERKCEYMTFFQGCVKYRNLQQSIKMSTTQSLATKIKDYYDRTMADNTNFFRSLGIKESEGFWVFGYGSLLWYVNFEYSEVRIGTIDGFKRRFWQGSVDHRGTPEKPGRVVTLIQGTKEDKLWGKAYYIPPECVSRTLETLNFREKGGYSLSKVLFTPRNDSEKKIDVLLYIAVEGNANYIGEEPIEDTALCIFHSVGPSGPNIDYLFNLAEALEKHDEMSDDDQNHTIALRDRVKQLALNNKTNP